MKLCHYCEIEKPLSSFYVKKNGYIEPKCKQCKSEAHRKYRNENPEKFRAGVDRWQTENRERLLEYQKQYAKDNRELKNATNALYRAQQALATIWWANLQEVKSIYMNCPAGYEVDHIVPLISPIVCGLHWELNLKCKPISENRAKSNLHWPTMSAQEVREATKFYANLSASS